MKFTQQTQGMKQAAKRVKTKLKNDRKMSKKKKVYDYYGNEDDSSESDMYYYYTDE